MNKLLYVDNNRKFFVTVDDELKQRIENSRKWWRVWFHFLVEWVKSKVSELLYSENIQI